MTSSQALMIRKSSFFKLSHRSQILTFEFLELKVFEKKTKKLNENKRKNQKTRNKILETFWPKRAEKWNFGPIKETPKELLFFQLESQNRFFLLKITRYILMYYKSSLEKTDYSESQDLLIISFKIYQLVLRIEFKFMLNNAHGFIRKQSWKRKHDEYNLI